MSMSPSEQRQRWRSPAIDDVAPIPNGQGELALLDLKGNVVSWSLPEAHGVPVCHELYDAPWETAFRLGLDDKEFSSGRRYEDASHTLVSTWRSSTGLARERACMVGSPATSAGNRLARLFTCERGAVNARLDLRLRYGHRGEQPVQWTVLRYTPGFVEATATVGNMRLFLATNMSLEFDDDATSVTGRLALKSGESAFAVIGWGGHTSPATVDEVEDLIDASDEGWQNWVQGLQVPDNEHAPLITESAIRLRGTGHHAGSFYAAASRGLPEDDTRVTRRSKRTWDYLFDWLRDSGRTVTCLDRLGDREVLSARKRWYDSLPDLRRKAKIMYGANGEDVALLGEHIVEELGYRGSLYRHGNGAGDQEQHDRWAFVLAHLRVLATRGVFDLDLTEALAEQAVAALFQPDSGTWERRAGMVVNIAAQILLGQALYDAAAIFRMASGRFEGAKHKVRRYATKGAACKQWVLDHGVQDGVIVAAPNLRELDASVLLAFLMGKDMFDLNDAQDRQLVESTVLAIDESHTTPGPFKGLRRGKGHVRYHQTPEYNDGVSEAEEPNFNNVTGWVAQVFLALGMLKRADAVMRDLLDGRNDLGMWPEMRTEDGVGVGNVNQAYVLQVVIDYLVDRAAFVAAQEADRSHAVAA